MPRSAKEWWAANDAWHRNQNRQIASIPYPGKDSVVYERESHNPYWARRYDNAASLIPSSINLSFHAEQISEFIDAAAAAEEAKEQEFLDKFFPDRKGGDMIEQFNILFQSRAQLEKINERLRAILSKQSNTNMAPNLSALFGSYLETELNHSIQAAMGNVSGNMTPEQIMSLFDNCFTQAALKASERLTNITIDKGYGTGEEWKPINDILQSNPRARDLFLGALRQAVGMERVQNLFSDIQTQQRAKAAGTRKKITWRTLIAKNLTIAKRTASIGGTVAETALAALASAVNGISGGGGDLKYSMHAENVLGNMVKTDAFMLFSEDASIDIGAIAEELNETLSASTNLDNARERLEWFLLERGKEMDELQSVFVNAKNYTMGSSYHDYTDEKSGSLEELPSFLAAAGIPIGSASDFLAFAYNTGAGAIRANARGELEENIVNALKAAAAKLMFDDYQNYGKNQGHGIHMYYLSGKYIPSSYVFHGMATAARGMRAKTEAQVSLPGAITDQGPNWPYGGSDADYKQALYAHWQEEYQNAKAASNWSVSFTLYMKNILASTL